MNRINNAKIIDTFFGVPKLASIFAISTVKNNSVITIWIGKTPSGASFVGIMIRSASID
jgi:hypothetical protein